MFQSDLELDAISFPGKEKAAAPQKNAAPAKEEENPDAEKLRRAGYQTAFAAQWGAPETTK